MIHNISDIAGMIICGNTFFHDSISSDKQKYNYEESITLYYNVDRENGTNQSDTTKIYRYTNRDHDEYEKVLRTDKSAFSLDDNCGSLSSDNSSSSLDECNESDDCASDDDEKIRNDTVTLDKYSVPEVLDRGQERFDAVNTDEKEEQSPDSPRFTPTHGTSSNHDTDLKAIGFHVESSGKKKTVRFSTVSVKEYAVTVGGIGCFEPYEVVPCPIELSWEHSPEQSTDLIGFEESKWRGISQCFINEEIILDPILTIQKHYLKTYFSPNTLLKKPRRLTRLSAAERRRKIAQIQGISVDQVSKIDNEQRRKGSSNADNPPSQTNLHKALKKFLYSYPR